MNIYEKLSQFCLVALMSIAITSSASAAQTGLLLDQSNTAVHSYQSLVHKVHATTVNEDGSRTIRHCKSKTECRYCTKKCEAPAKCIAKDCCTKWSKPVCVMGPAPEDLKTYN